jgi:hypothetical protein
VLGAAPFHEGARVGLIRRILARVNASAVLAGVPLFIYLFIYLR